MKKAIVLLLIAALCLSATACGVDKGGQADHLCSGSDWVVTKEADCVNPGAKEHRCACGAVVATDTIPATGHSYKKGVCTTCGAVDADYVETPSEGLEFSSKGDGTCYVVGIGSCVDQDLWLPETSPAGDKVVWVGAGAFADNTKLTSVIIPSTVTRIDDGAFKNCTGLKAIYGSEGLTSVGKSAFMGCTSLKSVELGQKLVHLQTAAFHSCSSLETVTLPETLKYINQTVFYWCTSLTEITIPAKVHTVESSAFYGCTALKTVTVEDGVQIIQDSVFADCTALEQVTFGQSLSSIRARAFEKCTSLKEIVIPENVTSLGREAFSCCIALTNVTIKANRVISYDNQFLLCSEVKLIVPDSLVEDYRNHYSWSFFSISGENTPGGSVGSHGLEYTSNKDGTCFVSGIGSCTDRVVVIPEYAPSGDRVTKIGSYAFEKCSDITAVEIPTSVIEIGAGAFMDCSSLQSLEIPESVEQIGGSMILGCHSLKVLIIRSTVVLNYPSPPMHTQDSTYDRISVVYVPAHLVEEYRNAYGWSPFGEKIQAIEE